MDFQFSEEQIQIQDLAREILEKELTLEHLKQVESGGTGFSAPLWSKLAEANLLGLAVPESLGGMGFGFLELCVLLGELGRSVAPVPAVASLVSAGLAIAELGNETQTTDWLVPLAAGEISLSAALVDAGSGDPTTPATTARRDGDDWLLDGGKRLVPSADAAARIVVPARCGDGVALFLLDPGADGVSLVGRRTSTGERLFDLELVGARVSAGECLPADAAALARIHECSTVAVCAMQIGVSERALEITTGYLKERHQFGAPLGSFPVVQHRCADAWMDLEALRWTTWRAAWKLARGEAVAREAAVAKFWAADAGSRIATATQHLHGGMGVDVDYPIHRYFLWAKSLELTLGGATPQLVRLGRQLAQSGPQEFA